MNNQNIRRFEVWKLSMFDAIGTNSQIDSIKIRNTEKVNSGLHDLQLKHNKK